MSVARRALAPVVVACWAAWPVACTPAPARPAPPAPSNAPAAEPGLAPLTGPIRVGVYLPMTGPSAAFGRSTLAGIQQAVAARNAGGGVRGAQIDLVTLDTAGKITEAATTVARLVYEEHVVALLGEATSAASLAGADLAQSSGVPMITPSATNAAVTAVGDRIFRACFVDETQARAMARFAREHLRLTRVAVLADVSAPYSLSLAETFAADLAARGGQVVADLRYQGGGAVDPTVLATLKAASPEAVYAPGYYPDVAAIAIALRKLGVTAPLLGGDGWDSAELGGLAGVAIDGSYYTNHFAVDDPRDVARTFATRFAREQGAPPDSLAALGHDAALVLLDAMARAPTLDGAALSEAIAATRVEGASGTLVFDGARDPVKPVVVLEMKAQVPRFAAAITP